MTDKRLRELRHLHRHDRAIPADLLALLQEVASKFVRLRLLPPSYSPYGRWDAEAAEEILQSWLADRLIGRGNLQRMLDQASTAAAFRAMAERSLRQHLIGQKSRSQLGNTFHRAAALLEGDESFERFAEAAQRHRIYWGLAEWEDPPLFAGDENLLLANAWSLGDFTVVRYRTDAKKLPPVLPGEELRRFLLGLLGAVGECLTLAQIMRVIEARFDLGESTIEQLDAAADVEPEEAVDEIGLREAALLVLQQLTSRQAEVLAGRHDGQTLEELAERLGCSPATIFNEEKRIRLLVEAEAESPADAKELLKILADLLYSEGEQV